MSKGISFTLSVSVPEDTPANVRAHLLECLLWEHLLREHLEEGPFTGPLTAEERNQAAELFRKARPVTSLNT